MRFTSRLRSLLTLLAAGAMVVGVAAEAKAVSYGYSFVEVTNLEASFVGADGTRRGFGGSFTFTGDTGATLTGFPAAGDSATVNTTFSCDRGIGCPPGPVDPLQAFRGNVAANPGQNDFSAQGTADVSYARADHILTDVLINTIGCADAVGGCDAVAGFGGDWEGVAESAVVGAREGTGSSGNNQTWDFGLTVLPNATTVTVEFDIDATIFVSTSLPGENATADWSLSLAMQVDGPTGTGTTRTMSLDASQTTPGFTELNDEDINPGFGTFTANPDGTTHVEVTFTVPAGSYRFKITNLNNVSADSTLAVPQPMSLALLGLGLTGLGALASRRRKKS